MSSTTTEGGSGLFLVFEGVEGAGKSTHVGRVSRRLDRHGIAHLVVREPGGTPVGERIRSMVLDPEAPILPATELLLILAARAEFVRRVVRPALERGELVLADRYEMSTFAYQGIARGLGLQEVRVLNAFATGGLHPHVTFLLDVDPDVGRGRKSGVPDRMESEDTAFHRAVAEGYARLAREDPAVVRIPSAGRPADVHVRIWAELARRWPDRFPEANGKPEGATG